MDGDRVALACLGETNVGLRFSPDVPVTAADGYPAGCAAAARGAWAQSAAAGGTSAVRPTTSPATQTDGGRTRSRATVSASEASVLRIRR